MKRRRIWPWILAALGVLLAAGGAIFWDAHRRANVVIERHRKEAAELLAAHRAKDFRRPPLEGEGVKGNAWDLYARHLPALKLTPDEEAEIPEVDGTWDPERRPDDEVLDVLYLKYAPHIEGLREALRRWVVDPRVSYEQGSAVDLSLIGPAISAARVLAGGMAHHHRMGRGKQALDHAALGLGLAHDQRPAVIGLLVRIMLEGVICENMFLLLAEHRLSAADLEHFAGILDRLDAARPSPADAWDEEELFLRCSLSIPDLGEHLRATSTFRPPSPEWRQVWSWKVAQAQALSLVPRYIEEGRRVLELPTSARAAEVDRLIEEWKKESTPLLRETLPGLLPAFQKDVESLTLRTLLRVGVALAWYEVEKNAFPPTLDALVPRYLARVPACPYSGKPLGTKDGQVWSVGADGVDDGGTWDPMYGRLFHKPGTDVVCTVKRRK